MNVLQNRDVEVALIGASLNSRECARKVAELPGDMFSHPDTKAAQKAVQRLLKAKSSIDLITLYAETEKEYPEPSMLVGAMAAGGLTSMFDQWVAIADDARRRRAILTTAQEVLQAVQSPAEDPVKLASQLAAGSKVVESEAKSIGMAEALAKMLETIGDRRKACQTGISGFDSLTGGIRGGKLIIIGARPGIGKTALALDMGKHVAAHSGGVLVVSLEMSEEEIMARLYANESGVDVQELESGKLSEEAYATLAECGPSISQLPIRISTRCTTPMQIRQEAVRMQEMVAWSWSLWTICNLSGPTRSTLPGTRK